MSSGLGATSGGIPAAGGPLAMNEKYSQDSNSQKSR